MAAATLLLPSCGEKPDRTATTASASSGPDSSSPSKTSSNQSHLEKLLTRHLGATDFKTTIHQPEVTHLTCTMPDGEKRTWVLSIITHPGQVGTYTQMVGKNRATPGFERDLEQGAFWGHNGEPTLTVISRNDLAFVLANHTSLPFHQLAAAITNPEIGGKWRSDAAKIAIPLADHLRKTFPSKN